MIRIKTIVEHESYEVNGKEVYKDTNGNWVARQELTPNEVKAFTSHKINAIDNPEFKKHPEASYIY
jgi:hypothetical protein